MIKLKNERFQNGTQLPTVYDERTLHSAAHFLIEYELFKNCALLEYSPTKIVTGNGVLGSHDRTTFEGDAADMAFLYHIVTVAILLGYSHRLDTVTHNAAYAAFDSFTPAQKDALEFQKYSIYGTIRQKFYLTLGLVSSTDDQAMFLDPTIRPDDFLAAVLLVNETKCSLKEALEWAKPLKYNLAGQPTGF